MQAPGRVGSPLGICRDKLRTMHVPRISLSRIWSLAVPSLFIGGLAWTLAGCHEDHAPGGGRKDDSWLPGEACLRGAKEPGCTELDEEILLDARDPTQIVGSGTPESCTSEVVVSAIAEGGIIHFDCGSEPHTIVLKETAKIMNDSTEEIVIDGGGLITLSGGGERRILYMNTCDPALVWTTPHCDNQDHPRLTLQNLRFVDGARRVRSKKAGEAGRFSFAVGDSKSATQSSSAIAAKSSGLIWAVALFECSASTKGVRSISREAGLVPKAMPETAARTAAQSAASASPSSSRGVNFLATAPSVTGQTPRGKGRQAEEAAARSISTGTIFRSRSRAFVVRIEANHAREGGGAIFFVRNDRSGSLRIEHSELIDNRSEGFETSGYPGIFILADGDPEIVESVLR